MARKLANKTNVDAPAFPYSFGKIRDNSGIGDGTPVNEDVYGDFHQFFEILPGLGSVTLNDLPENATNGFQYITALQGVLLLQFDFWHSVGQSLQPAYQNSFTNSTVYTAFEQFGYFYAAKERRVYFRGACQRATESSATVFTLPVAYRPSDDRAIPIVMKNNGNFIPGIMKINASTGAVSFETNAGDGATTAVYITDGASYNLY